MRQHGGVNVNDRTPKADLVQAVRATSGNGRAGSSGHKAPRADVPAGHFERADEGVRRGSVVIPVTRS